MPHCQGMLPEKTPLIFLIGILGWLSLSCFCLNFTSLDVRGLQASQVSDLNHDTVDLTADLAIDGDSRTSLGDFTCSHTGINLLSWWKLDLGTNHCLGRITLVNRGDSDSGRLSGAIVRAGKESDIFTNAACGLPVTSDQASVPGAHLQFVCDPPVIARYVSVDKNVSKINGFESTLTLCEVMIEEYHKEDCTQTKCTFTNTSLAIPCMSTLLYEGKCVNDLSPLLAEVNAKSPMLCFLSCKMNKECLSFDYVMTSGQCRLYDVKAGDLKVDDQPGCLVYVVVRG